MRLILTAGQTAALTPHLQPGKALLGRVMREPFDGSNAATCGRFIIELGTVRETALPGLRAAIIKANTPPAKRAPRASKGRGGQGQGQGVGEGVPRTGPFPVIDPTSGRLATKR